MGMNPLDFLNSFLAKAKPIANNVGMGIQEGLRGRYDPDLYTQMNPYQANRYRSIAKDIDTNGMARMMDDGIIPGVSNKSYNGDLPDWAKSVANTRSSAAYSSNLRDVDEITYGGKKIRFVESDPGVMGQVFQDQGGQARNYRQNSGFADGYNTEGYERGLAALIRQKEALTGKRYNIQ